MDSDYDNWEATEPRTNSTRQSRLKLKLTANVNAHNGDEVPNSGSYNNEESLPHTRSRSGRSVTVASDQDSRATSQPRVTRSGRAVAVNYADSEDDDDQIKPLGKQRAPNNRLPRPKNDDFIASDGDEAIEDSEAEFGARRSSRRVKPPPPKPKKSPKKKKRRQGDDDPDFQSDTETDETGSHDFDAPLTSPSPEPPAFNNNHASHNSPRGYTLRPQRREINYQIPPPLDNDLLFAATAAAMENTSRPKPRTALPRNLTQSIFDKMGALPPPPPIIDDSDSDDPGRQPNKSSNKPGEPSGGQGLIGAGGATSDPSGSGGGPANFGKVSKDSLLADTDPLGVNVNVTFDEVGGLEDHVSALKEMVTLPLLYPEIFQQFKITPPRGVLFHGPPGTGKTLVARALAAESRNNGREIAFFMRKGADILSKWVGEAERQLRLLFEEARNSQPSIIFFDEIDGLAPVRSSKQDQIHASIVSTLLALMDGMDGRGQVIVIGATNRPDAVDPALRRPGRFDREFYFPLPDLGARKKILGILTRGWTGWQGEEGVPVVNYIAEATKGYGGADLRALATEATLNAIQRSYPQIYKSKDRLIVKPDTIKVTPRDFLISVRKLVASSQRSTASVTAPLPQQLAPLLEPSLQSVRDALTHVLPISKPRKVLDEAEWEDEDGEDAGFEREMRLQALETLRVYRPRLLIHGPPGMGQSFVAAAALYNLEGVHLQSVDLGTLYGDSSRSAEAAIVQLFVEAKRRKPSVIYIPSVISWCNALSEATRTTFKELLDSLLPTDPVLVLGVLQGDVNELPLDVRHWFGYGNDNLVALGHPSAEQRAMFFKPLLDDVSRPPNQFPDTFRRRKRILPVLPVAPPPPPKKASPAEMAVQLDKDRHTLVLLTARLGEILSELKKKYRRVTRSAQDSQELIKMLTEAAQNSNQPQLGAAIVPPTVPDQAAVDVEMGEAVNIVGAVPDGAIVSNGVIHDHSIIPNGIVEPPPPVASNLPTAASADGVMEIPSIQTPLAAAPEPLTNATPAPPIPKCYDIDIDRMQLKLYDKVYLTPADVLNDLSRIVHNTRIEPCNKEHVFKAHQMYSEFEAIIWDPQFKQECDRMAIRERVRRAEAKAPLSPPKPDEPSAAAGDVSMSASNEQTGERSLKRPREDGAAGDDSGVDSPNGSKRMKLSEPEMATGGESGTNAVAQSSSHPIPSTSLGVDPTSQTRASSFASEPDRRSPPPILPDFILDPSQRDALEATLVHQTENLTVEQLEELRAICLDHVWRSKGDWNRSKMIDDIRKSAEGYIARIISIAQDHDM